MDFYIGSIWSFGFSWAPLGMALCNGQLVPIAQNEALFSLIGTTYGGDGISTFALPNTQGRVPIGFGQGPGLPNYAIGQMGGSETVTLTTQNLPQHTHFPVSVQLPGSTRDGEANDPTGNFFGLTDSNIGNAYNNSSDVNMASGPASSTGVAGNSQPLNIMSPYQVVSYCICTEGIYPSRN